MPTYIENIRKKIGHQKIIHPAARIIIENDFGQVLFIVRKDNGNLGIPAGGLEENETIEACIKREVEEEIGLTVTKLKLIGLSSNPKLETVTYPNGDVVQYFTCEFYTNHFLGEIKVDKNEISFAKFMSPNNFERLPANEKSIFESLEFFKKNGTIMLK